MREILVSPSLLSADKSALGKEAVSCRESGADWLHYDVIDGHFAPNITFGADFVSALSGTGLFNDVHLMIENPLKYAPRFVAAGADLITFHFEAVNDPLSVNEEIRRLSPDIRVGISVKPRTPAEKILPILNFFDVVLVMSVEPGFSGQKFIPGSLDKIRLLRKAIDGKGLSTKIEVDGGVNAETAPAVREAGADVLVTGSFFFSAMNRKEAVEVLKGKK